MRRRNFRQPSFVPLKNYVTILIPQITTPLIMFLFGKVWNVENDKVKPSKPKQKKEYNIGTT